MTTNILTGQVLFDNLPVVVQSASAQLNGIGSMSGVLQMRNDLDLSVRINMIAALEPYKSVFWIFQDNQPIWAGPIIAWNPSTMVGATLPFQAATMESMFQYRLITESINFDNEDASFVFRELALYAVSKEMNSQISGLNISGPYLNTLINASFAGSNDQSVYDAWNTLISTYDLEYTIMPVYADQSGGSLALQFQLLVGSPLMRPYSATNLQFTYPSKNVLDYQYIRQNNNLANVVYATGTDSTINATSYESNFPNGVNQTELNNGYPLLESTVTIQQPVSGQSEVDAYATVWSQNTGVQDQITPSLVMGPNAYPKIADIRLGDECVFVATSPIHPAPTTGGPGLIMAARITGWTITPPSQGTPETATINLGALTEVISSG